MSRPIKFRQAIIHPITKEFWKWHYWGFINNAFVGIDTGICSPKAAVENSQQFTGLKDKQGVEIYEGDIVNHKNYWTDLPNRNSVIKWDDFIETAQGYKSVGYFLFEGNEKLEVVGNIHSSPELLEEKSND